MERTTLVRKPHTSTADLLTWFEIPTPESVVGPTLCPICNVQVEWLTSITWQDAGKVELVEGSSYLGQPLPFFMTTLIWIKVLFIGYIKKEADTLAGRVQECKVGHGWVPWVCCPSSSDWTCPIEQLGYPLE